MPKILNITIPIIIAFILFIFLEIILRAFFVNPNSLSNYGYNPSGLGDLLPNKNFIDANVKRLPYLVITNSEGLRNEEEIDFSDNTFRILTIGDSFTYCPYVNNQDTWQAILERKIKNEYPDKKIQVLNAGVAGYTITDELEYLKEKGIKTKPDLIILGIYTNDVDDLNPEKREVYARIKQKQIVSGFWAPFRNIAKKTAFFSWLEEIRARTFAGKIKQIKKEQSKEINSSNLARYLVKLDEFIQYAEKNNFELLVVLFPEISQLNSSKNNFQKEIAKDLEAKNISYIDLLPLFKEEQFKNFYLLPFNSHLSSYGNFTVANIAFNYKIKESIEK